MNYKVYRNGLGKVSAVVREDGATIPYQDETDLITIIFRYWEAVYGALDLSDHPVSYTVFRNDKGKVDAINRDSDGATVPVWDETDPLTIDLREWEAVNGALDLSDRPPPVPVKAPDYRGFYNSLLSESLELFLYVRSIADQNLPVSNCYTDLMGAIQFEQFPGFQSAIYNLFGTMAAVGYGFSPEQTKELRTLLDVNGFAAIVLP